MTPREAYEAGFQQKLAEYGIKETSLLKQAGRGDFLLGTLRRYLTNQPLQSAIRAGRTPFFRYGSSVQQTLGNATRELGGSGRILGGMPHPLPSRGDNIGLQPFTQFLRESRRGLAPSPFGSSYLDDLG